MPDENKDEPDIQWQCVPMAKKRSHTGSPLIWKKPAFDTTGTLNSANRFDILREDNNLDNENHENAPAMETNGDENNDNEANNTEGASSVKPPPIFLSDVNDIRGMMTYICKHIQKDSFSYKSQRDGHVRVSIKSVNTYRQLVDCLRKDKIKFHTYQLKQDRAFRVVVKNLHYSTPAEFIKQEIEELGHEVRSVNIIKSRITKEPLNMFFIDLEPNNKNSEIYQMKYIGNAVVKVEQPRKVNDIVQCFRCQEFGHTKSYCTKNYKCVKCSLDHPTNDCPKSKELPAKCANCLERHAASYKGCRVYQELVVRKDRPIGNHIHHANTNSFQPIKSNNISQNESQPTYAQVLQGNHGQRDDNPLERIEALLAKQFELTNNLLNMITLLINQLCK